MKIPFWIAILGAGLLMPGANAKADYEVMTRNDILFAEHDGVRLLGDFYAAKGVEKAPGAEGQLFPSEYRSDPLVWVPAKVKAVVGFYGVYDMLAQWEHDLLARPRDNISEKFLRAAPYTNRQIFFEASPISYTTADKN